MTSATIPAPNALPSVHETALARVTLLDAFRDIVDQEAVIYVLGVEPTSTSWLLLCDLGRQRRMYETALCAIGSTATPRSDVGPMARVTRRLSS